MPWEKDKLKTIKTEIKRYEHKTQIDTINNYKKGLIKIFVMHIYVEVHLPCLDISTGHRTMSGKKNELRPTKASSQRTQLSGMKLSKFYL